MQNLSYENEFDLHKNELMSSAYKFIFMHYCDDGDFSLSHNPGAWNKLAFRYVFTRFCRLSSS